MNLITKAKNALTVRRNQGLKEQLLKNDEALLDIMAKNIEGARQCPFLMGHKCLGQFCEHFKQYTKYNSQTDTTETFYQCVHVETPELLIELNRNIRELITLMQGDSKC